MLDYLKNMDSITFLRVTLGFMFVRFGVDHVVNVVHRAGWVPEWMTTSRMSAELMTYIVAALDIIFGAMLFFGVRVRLAALFFVIQFASIIVLLTGLGPIGMRDLTMGLAVAALLFKR